MSDDHNNGFFNGPTRRVGGGANETTKTRPPKSPPNDTIPVPQAKPAVAERSEFIEPKTRRVSPAPSPSSSTTPANNTTQQPDFVVGWLVVSDGPGRGASKPIGYGMNSIGRGADSLIQLDYGDEEISRNTHCHIAYDHKHKKFYIQHGGGQNLTYLDDAPVLSSCELPNRSRIVMGNTTLTFIQLCGDNFDWE